MEWREWFSRRYKNTNGSYELRACENRSYACFCFVPCRWQISLEVSRRDNSSIHMHCSIVVYMSDQFFGIHIHRFISLLFLRPIGVNHVTSSRRSSSIERSRATKCVCASDVQSIRSNFSQRERLLYYWGRITFGCVYTSDWFVKSTKTRNVICLHPVRCPLWIYCFS